MTWPDTYKGLAGIVWRAAHGQLSKAVRDFSNLLVKAEMQLPANVREFVAAWGPCLNEDGTIRSGASRSGRKRKLTDAQVEACYEQASNWAQLGRSRPYGSMQEMVETNPVVKGVVQATGVTAGTLAKKMKLMHPTFGWKQVAIKDILTPEHKLQRLSACKRMLAMPERALQLVVWIDAKSMILTVTKRHGWVDTRVRDYEERKRPPQQQGKIINLKYYIAVSPLLGPLWLRFCTGTTGMPWNRDGKAYKVRLMLQTGQGRALHARAPRPPSTWQPTARASAACPRSHPHTAKALRSRRPAPRLPAASPALA